MLPYLELSQKNLRKASDIIKDTNVIKIWEGIGAEINLVGSVSTGLLMKNKDIDFHIYTPELSVKQSFQAISLLAQNKSIRHIEYTNLIDTEEECIEWHATYEDHEGETWHIDMIHILKGSKYDGYFERMAARISAILTNETRNTILRLKHETPDDVRIMGVQYYQAVLRDNIRTYAELTSWLERNPVTGVIEWIP